VTSIANSANNNDTSTPAAATATTATPDATKFQVKIHVADKENFLPGMSVTANIETRHRTNALSVPIQCVTTRLPKKSDGTNTLSTNHIVQATETNSVAPGQKKPDEPPKAIAVVFVVEGDHVKMVPVKIGISDENYVEITDGLHDGEEVVSGGYKAINRDLAEGTKVVVNKETAGQDKETKAN
jgi:HlyD family secretion protein